MVAHQAPTIEGRLRSVTLLGEGIANTSTLTRTTTLQVPVAQIPQNTQADLALRRTNGSGQIKLNDDVFDVTTLDVPERELDPLYRLVAFALDELKFFSRELRIVGVYPAHPFRATFSEQQD